jgi:hypothetical protein
MLDGLALGLFALDAFLLGVDVGVQTGFHRSTTQATSASWMIW